MDWQMIYRNGLRMTQLLAEVPEVEVASLDQFRDPDGPVQSHPLAQWTSHPQRQMVLRGRTV